MAARTSVSTSGSARSIATAAARRRRSSHRSQVSGTTTWSSGPLEPWGTRSLLLRDPKGNLVDLFSPVTPAAPPTSDLRPPTSDLATSRSGGA